MGAIKIVYGFLASLFFILAIIGGLLPLVQGFIFFIIGLGFLIAAVPKKHRKHHLFLWLLRKRDLLKKKAGLK